MTSNAQRGLELNKKHGNKCATSVGRATGNILANRKPLTDARVKRMYAYLERAAVYYDPSDSSACGTISYLLWGGKAALRWSKARVNEMEQKEKELATEYRKKYGDNVEVRTVDVRAASDDAPRVVEGYAAVFDQVTDLGTFKEVIDRNAFEGRLEDDVRLLFNHEGQPLARTTNGTLQLSTDDTGLHYRAELADTTAGRDLFELIKRGDVTQSSFAFTIEKEERESSGVRRVKKVGSILDVAPVVYPAYVATSVVTSRNENQPEPPTESTDTETVEKMDTAGMTLNDLKAKRAQISEELNALTVGIETENRNATEHENEQLDKYSGELEKLDGFILRREKAAEATARMAQMGTSSTTEKRELESIGRQFSISRAISAVSNGRNLLGAELEMAQEAAHEAKACGVQMRGQVAIPSKLMYRTADDHQAGSGESGAAFVPTVTGPAIDGLRQPTLMERLGTTVINATGNLEFPKVTTNATADVNTEVATGTDSGLAIGSLTLTPQRANNTTTYSKQLLLQGGNAVDALITRELVAGVNQHIDEECFGVFVTDAGEATPQVNVEATTTLSYTVLAAMESLVLTGGGDLGGASIVCSPDIHADFRSLAAVSNISAAYDGNTIMGYTVYGTPHIGTGNKFLLGNFGQAGIMARFGGLDVLVDPFSAASTAQTKLYCTQYFDYDIRQGKAMAINIAVT